MAFRTAPSQRVGQLKPAPGMRWPRIGLLPPFVHRVRIHEYPAQGRVGYAPMHTEGVASFGPMNFDGSGGVTLSETVNLPCANPSQTCDRTIADIIATGTYTVNSDGTGVATFAFKFTDGTPIGTEVYDFVINAATRRGRNLLATQVFAADRSGGLAGQLVAPTWGRVSD